MGVGEIVRVAGRDLRTTAGEAFECLLERYEQPVYAYLVALLGDRDLAQDCNQDTFLRALQQLHRGKNVNVRWLYTVARNRAIDHLRERRRTGADTGVLDAMPSAEEQEPPHAADVRRVLARLSGDDREILYLFSVDGFRTDEIAGMLGIQPGALRVRLTRARQRFRALYEEKS